MKRPIHRGLVHQHLIQALLALAMWTSAWVPAQAADAILPFERSSLKAIEKQHAAQPYWLVLWDLDCTYCAQSMKNLGAAQQGDPKLRIVSIATDPISEQAQLQARLQSYGLHGEAYAFGDDPPEALRYAIDPKWRGEKPRAYYYDGKGQRRAFIGVLSQERIAAP